MQTRNGQLVFSASDLAAWLECAHLTALDLWALDDDALRARKVPHDESAELIATRGIEHEKAHLGHLRAQGLSVVDVADLCAGERTAMAGCTRSAMHDGLDVIYQAALEDGALAGFADFLMKVADQAAPGPGGFRYEAADTKLARTPKAKFLVQLAFYSHLLERAQGGLPQYMYLVLGDRSVVRYRCADFVYYFRALLERYQSDVERLVEGEAAAYPLPCSHCAMCHWRTVCEERRLSDDHLSQVANITQGQIAKLEAAGIRTLEAVARSAPGVPVPRLHPGILERLQSQAALQWKARQTGQRHMELLPVVEDGGRGFLRLPPPDTGDLFFDMEGSPLEEGGLEYLFGVWYRDADRWDFRGFWAHDRVQERRAFEDFMDFVARRLQQFPGAHVYHYASYEQSALKRLASQHATREVEVDNLLRERVLVDLYQVVREALRTSEPSYSIKYIERFYRPRRSGDVQNAGASIVFYERWRETRDPDLLAQIEAYNRDDVESTWQLHEWLLGLRPAGLPWRSIGAPASRPLPADVDPEARLAPTRAQLAEQRLVPYGAALLGPLPADRNEWTPAHQQRELVYLLLDFHRRAAKPQWWALYERRDREHADLLDDAECLAGLTLDPAAPPYLDKRSTVYTYIAPEQETKLSDGDACTRTDTGQPVGALSFDPDTRRVRLRLGPRKDPLPAELSLGPGQPIESDPLTDAIYRFADSVLACDGRFGAIRALLDREPPRFRGRAPGQPVIAPGTDTTEGAVAAALELQASCLYVQGPPGAGKTYTGSRMIARLLAAGRRVGIMSNSHKAINHLMAGAVRQAQALGLRIRAVKKASRDNPESAIDEPGLDILNVHSNDDVLATRPDLVGGTAWLFAAPDLEEKVDVLFVDEAGQVALANIVAAGTCARSIVLLGDQMQLSQPVQGVHPGRSGDSVLDYLLDGAATISPQRGIFLGTSYRMHPTVCGFISDAVYESRLQPEPTNERRTLVLGQDAHPLLRPAGIVHAPIEHAGCSQSSHAEAQLVAEIYASALRQHHTDREGGVHPVTPEDILVVAPYNAQVNLLRRTLPPDARVGTVDKFQGQEAPIVLVSMTTSSELELPRNMEFLYSKNRLNVAISRAQSLAVVLANPRLLAIRCSTPQQMALVNMLCWMAALE